MENTEGAFRSLPTYFSMILWLFMSINDYYYLIFHSVPALPQIPRCFSVSDWYGALCSACWNILWVLLSPKWHRDLTACFARGVSLLFKVITFSKTRQRDGIIIIPTLQARNQDTEKPDSTETKAKLVNEPKWPQSPKSILCAQLPYLSWGQNGVSSAIEGPQVSNRAQEWLGWVWIV